MTDEQENTSRPPLTMKEVAAMGGRETYRRHGSEYMRAISRKAVKAKYGDRLKPPVTEGRSPLRLRKESAPPEGAGVEKAEEAS